MPECPACGAENGEQAKFCRSCGAGLAATADAGPWQGTCGNCGEDLRPGATFCRACGAKVEPAQAGTRGSGFNAQLAGIVGGAVAVVAALAIAAFVLLGGGNGDGGDDTVTPDIEGGLVFAEPEQLSANAKDDLAAALAALPDPVGDTEAEQLRSVLGPPDVFQLWFEPLDDGGTARSETWYYLDLEVSYEFRDGVLLFTIPMDEVPGLVLVPLRYDPLEFNEATTVDDVRAMLDDPTALIPEEMPAEYELGVTIWAGEQIMAAFDESGELLYVETVAMDLGDGS